MYRFQVHAIAFISLTYRDFGHDRYKWVAHGFVALGLHKIRLANPERRFTNPLNTPTEQGYKCRG